MNEKKIYKVFEEISLPIQIEKVDVKLPIAFEYRYDYREITILNENKRFILIKEKRSGSIESFITQSDKIGEITGQRFILVFTEIPESTRKLLLKARIPFLDYKGNLFIPDLGMSLKRIKNIASITEDKLTPSEQAVLIYILLSKEKRFTPNEISEITNVSVPTIYRILKKFSSLNWIESWYGSYSLLLSKRDIFDKATPLFINPKKESVYLRSEDIYRLSELEKINTTLKISGLSALSRFSNLASSEDVYAISLKRFKDLFGNLRINKNEVFEINIGNMVELELWSYSPFSLNNDWVVDPISCYFSLKDKDDPRIEMELDKLLYKIKQSLE